MANTAADLVDHVLPIVPYRQWVLSLPRRVRFLLARDSDLLSQTLGVFLTKLFARQRRRARAHGIAGPHTGAITFVQRFGALLKPSPRRGAATHVVLDAKGAARPHPGDIAASRLVRLARDEHLLELPRVELADARCQRAVAGGWGSRRRCWQAWSWRGLVDRFVGRTLIGAGGRSRPGTWWQIGRRGARFACNADCISRGELNSSGG